MVVGLVLAVPLELNGNKLTVYVDKDDAAYRIASCLYNYRDDTLVADKLNQIIANKLLGYNDVELMTNGANEYVLYRTPADKSFFLATVYLGKIIPNDPDVYIGFMEEGKTILELTPKELETVKAYLETFDKLVEEMVK